MGSMAGLGVYDVSEASRLTGVTVRRIRRWFRGYHYRGNEGTRHLPPVIRGCGVVVDGQLQLSFLDLIEVRVINKFLEFGVGWKELRRAALVGAELLQSSHPFATFRFRTDGRSIFASVNEESGDHGLIELSSHQNVFRQIIEPALHGVDFEGQFAVRWWLLGERRRIVIDPSRAFGRPIASKSGVPAQVLASYAERFGTPAARDWFEVDTSDVKDSIIFAKRFAA